MEDSLEDDVVDAVEQLSKELGIPPSVAQIAERAGIDSVGTTHNNLKAAAEKGRIAYRRRKYMSLEMAEAWPIEQEKGKEK